MKHTLILSLLILTSLACQNSNDGELVKREVPLVEGLGYVRHRVATADNNAQAYFDQGLAYIYAFNHAEAIRAFDQAAKIDPKLAMAHWGRAYALGPNYNVPEIDKAAAKAAYDAAQEALKLELYATEKEKYYIRAIARRYSADPNADVKKLQQDYTAAMKALYKRYPQDLDAATLYAEAAMNLRPWKLYTADGTPEPGTEEIVAVLEEVLARNPNHTGANHYYIHATEASRTPERALPSAKKLGQLAPNAGHLVHMPAHVYVRVGDYDNAIKVNEVAARVDEKAMTCCGPKQLYFAMYYSHNLHFLSYAAAMAGQSGRATEAAGRLAKNVEVVADEMTPIEPFAAYPLMLMVRQAQWVDILKYPAPKATRLNSTATFHFARGMAHAAMKDVAKALEEQEKFKAAAEKSANVPVGNNTSKDVFVIAGHLLAGKIALARGDKAGARSEMEKAVAVQDTLAYDEPPAFPWPVRESLGGLLLVGGDASGAEKVFEEDLKRNINNPRSLGLSEALKAQGKHAKSDEVKTRLDAAWRQADVTLRAEELQRMRRVIVPSIHPGVVRLSEDQAHHVRDVLRLREGDEIEIMTPAGEIAIARLRADLASAEVGAIAGLARSFDLTIASAIPKAARADWMIEKLSELNVARFIPLITARSVVHPEGKNKIERWQRLAAESAKQSRRAGVMQITPLTPLDKINATAYLSTTPDALPLLQWAIGNGQSAMSRTLLIGPEGGWADDEITLFHSRHLTPLSLGATILRVETAAIAAAAIVHAARSTQTT